MMFLIRELMKKSLFIWVVVLLSFSCEDVIDKQLLNAIDSDMVWHDPSLAELYLNGLYQSSLPGFGGLSNSDISDEARGSGPGQMMYGILAQTEAYGTYSVSTYAKIRNINILLQDIEFGSIPEADRRSFKGQAYFLRAWQYWELVRYYGGVPVVLTPQDPNEGNGLNLPRKSAAYCIETIVKDLDSAIAMTPAAYEASDYGRVTKAAAAAFKGRVLLFYASPQFNPSNDASRWQAAYEANVEAKQIAEANGHGLYPDFERVFLDEDNEEAIFITKYNGTSKVHGYENSARPSSVSNSKSTSGNPNWSFVQSFPMADGQSISESAAYDPAVFWKDRDPRFYATVGYNSMEWIFEERKDNSTRQWTYLNNNQEGNANSLTGFYTRKSVDNTLPLTQTAQTGTDWIEIRFAEVLLNLAESANEVGKTQEAYDELIAIRDRAGILPGGNSLYGLKAGMTKGEMRAAVLLERKIELAFENKRHWDMRRRNLFIQDSEGNVDQGYNGTIRTSIQTTVDTDYIMSQFPEITDSNVAFAFFEENVRDTVDWDNPDNYDLYFNTEFDLPLETQEVNFLQPKYNFYFLPQTALDKNPQLQQTINWTNGAFDPLAN